MAEFEAFLKTPWVYWTLLIAYTGSILSIVGIILSENRNPVKSLAWITVLMLFPVGGIILYIFFGRSIKNTHMISRRNRRRLRELTRPAQTEPDLTGLSEESRQQAMLARSLTGAPYHTGNSVKIYRDGADKFDALIADIAAAQRFINLQYYIFADDIIGHKIADALIERARAGVKVRVIYDDIGCFGVSRKFYKRMAAEGIEIHPFFRVAFPPFATRINWRNHRKLVIIDGKTGYIGGMNIADRYLDSYTKGIWRDTHMRVSGPAVGSLQYSFAVDWRFMGRELLQEEVEPAPEGPAQETVGMQMLTCGPTSEWSNISFLLLKAIGNAKKRVLIQTPYFLPTESLLKTIQVAALSKVDVRIMLPTHSDSLILTYASRSFVNECLRAGVKFYFFDAGMLHSKTVVVDDTFCSIGSANIDFRSFEHNFESNMFMYSRDVNRAMQLNFAEDMRLSHRIKPALWRRRPLLHKAFESILRLLSPVL